MSLEFIKLMAWNETRYWLCKKAETQVPLGEVTWNPVQQEWVYKAYAYQQYTLKELKQLLNFMKRR